jgi:hypothetical protein
LGDLTLPVRVSEATYTGGVASITNTTIQGMAAIFPLTCPDLICIIATYLPIIVMKLSANEPV